MRSSAFVLIACALGVSACDSSPANTGGAGGGTSSTGAKGSTGAMNTSSTMSGSMSTSNTSSTGSTPETCLGSNLLDSLGKDHVMAGLTGEDASATAAAFDIRYQYISGAIADGAGPCGSCATNCTAGNSCANADGGCNWWGCWQYDQDPPGAFVRDFVSKSAAAGEIPMITYYVILQASGVNEGQGEVDELEDGAFLSRYFADYRFLLQQIGSAKAIVHIEPDFWGYCEQSNEDPHAIPAAVPSANATDCGDQEASAAGLGRCFIAMTRKYAPNAKVSLHGSAWATKMDVLANDQASFDVVGEANKLGAFLSEAGPDADLVVVDAADRDAAYYESIGRDDWWDDTNATLPNFTQAFAWSKAVSEKYGKPNLWWQVPVGNMNQNNTTNHWKDNRLDYFYGHWNEVAASHGIGAAFGAGEGQQTMPETDGGNLISKQQAYAATGGQKLCP
jgi:hypothetical protein